MDAYLRDTGIEMETYSRNGVMSAGYRAYREHKERAAYAASHGAASNGAHGAHGDARDARRDSRDSRDSRDCRYCRYCRDYEAIVRAVLVAYVKGCSQSSFMIRP